LRLSRSSFIDCDHDALRGCLVNHMARSLDRMESTLRNVAMKPRRLSVNVDQPIVLARNDNNWHPEVAGVGRR